jgi:hypothetical protein
MWQAVCPGQHCPPCPGISRPPQGSSLQAVRQRARTTTRSGRACDPFAHIPTPLLFSLGATRVAGTGHFGAHPMRPTLRLGDFSVPQLAFRHRLRSTRRDPVLRRALPGSLRIGHLRRSRRRSKSGRSRRQDRSLRFSPLPPSAASRANRSQEQRSPGPGARGWNGWRSASAGPAGREGPRRCGRSSS